MLRWSLICLFSAMLADPASAADYYIVCDITQSYDFATGASGRITGSDTYGVTELADGSTNYDSPFNCRPESVAAEISEARIYIRCLQDLGAVDYERTVFIDRVTGEYTNTFGLPGQSGLAHFGTCHRTQAQF